MHRLSVHDADGIGNERGRENTSHVTSSNDFTHFVDEDNAIFAASWSYREENGSTVMK